MDAPLLARDDRRVAPDRRRADPERTARLAGVAPQRPVRVLGGVWPEESLAPRVHLRGGTGSGRTTSRLERVVVCGCERHPSGGNRSVSRGHPGPRRSLEPSEGLSRSLSSSPCFRFFDQGHPMALRWGLGFAVMSIMVAFAANSVMTRYIIVGGLATPYLLSTVRFRSEEHTSELQSPFLISYAVCCLKKKKGGQRGVRQDRYAHRWPAIGHGYRDCGGGRGRVSFFRRPTACEIYTRTDPLSLQDALPI